MLIKNILKPILPPLLVNLYRACRDNSLHFLSKKKQNWGIDFSNKECVIICNGPSLKKDLVFFSELFSIKRKNKC